MTLFEGDYVHILDWYHLQGKVRDLMTMIAPDKVLKAAYCAEVLGLLWVGKGAEALVCLQGYRYRNASKWEELQGYLSKNETHIIDYKRRHCSVNFCNLFNFPVLSAKPNNKRKPLPQLS